MAMDEMTADEFKQHLDSLLNEDFFPPIGITRNGERRMVVVPAEIFRAMHRSSRRAISTADLSKEQIKALIDAQPPEGLEHLNELLEGE
jgi:prevent-host-death family protein